MGLAVLPNDWTGLYIEQCVRWPDSPEWLAILRGQLTAPYETDFWDKFTGDPSDAQDAIEATFDQNLHTEECMKIPAGAILEFAGVTTPSGFLFCHGQEVSRITYADLFAVIGEIFGSGNGTTTFNVPDKRGKVGVGWSDVDNDFNDVGNTGGAKTHTLTVAELASHTHTQNAHTHVQNGHQHQDDRQATWGVDTLTANTTAYVLNRNQGNIAGPLAKTATTPTNQNTTPTNQNTGSGNEHNNLQPYLVFTYIIKV